MKRKSFILTGIVLLTVVISCNKKVTEPIPVASELAAGLYTSQSFVDFAKSFIVDYKNLAAYYSVPGIAGNKTEFINRLKAAGDNDAQVENLYSQYGLSLSELVIRKNKVDNDILTLLNQHKVLLKYSEQEVWEIIREAIDLGWQSKLPVWQDMRMEASANFSSGVRLNAQSATGYQVNRIAVDEVWDCLKGAIGVGSASVLGIAGLQKLAQQGIQEMVLAASGWLAKRAGWIGAAIVAIDFASCIYKESLD